MVTFIQLKSTHSFLYKFHVNRHEFSYKCLQMVDSFVPFLKSMLIFCCIFNQLSFELTIAIFHKFLKKIDKKKLKPNFKVEKI